MPGIDRQRRQAVTVRLPMARMALIGKVLARSQTGLEKSGANSTIRGNSSAGNVGIRKTPFGEEIFRSLCGLPLLFQRPGMDKVELCLIRWRISWLITGGGRKL
jgi:hypothetical protein